MRGIQAQRKPAAAIPDHLPVEIHEVPIRHFPRYLPEQDRFIDAIVELLNVELQAVFVSLHGSSAKAEAHVKPSPFDVPHAPMVHGFADDRLELIYQEIVERLIREKPRDRNFAVFLPVVDYALFHGIHRRGPRFQSIVNHTRHFVDLFADAITVLFVCRSRQKHGFDMLFVEQIFVEVFVGFHPFFAVLSGFRYFTTHPTLYRLFFSPRGRAAAWRYSLFLLTLDAGRRRCCCCRSKRC